MGAKTLSFPSFLWEKKKDIPFNNILIQFPCLQVTVEPTTINCKQQRQKGYSTINVRTYQLLPHKADNVGIAPLETLRSYIP